MANGSWMGIRHSHSWFVTEGQNPIHKRISMIQSLAGLKDTLSNKKSGDVTLRNLLMVLAPRVLPLIESLLVML
jgi:hypothetical protein